VSSGSTAQVRAAAARGAVLPPSAFVIEEIVNYHRHRIAAPSAGEAVALEARISAVGPGHRSRGVLQIGLSTAGATATGARAPCDLVLVVDCSGSMAGDHKLERVREALRTLVGRLAGDDRVGIVAYDDEARVVLPMTRRAARGAIESAIDSLQPGSATNLHGGLILGADLAQQCCDRQATRRVLLLTDGIANRGVTDPHHIAADARARARGAGISTIGVGQDVQHELLRTIARETRGQHHFVADAGDVAKVFVAELQSLLVPSARKVRLSLEPDRDLHVDVFGYAPLCRDGRVVIEIEDLGRDATLVVLAELRCGDAPADKRRFPVRVVLDYEDPACGNPVRIERVVSLTTGGDGEEGSDPEVTRNWRIAQLADAMREAAVAHEQGRTREARAGLERGLALARESQGDADVARVVAIAENLRLALAGSACLDR
jgi:Ca-activated chloride channel family protein